MVNAIYANLRRLTGSPASSERTAAPTVADLAVLPEDVLMITADHGCDPGFKGTDHTREYIPFLACGKQLKQNVDLGTRVGFTDIARTVLDLFDVEADGIPGESFKKEILS